MENENESGLCSSCCTLVVLGGISLVILRWDIDVASNWQGLDELDNKQYLIEVWTLGMCLNISFLWFSLPILVTMLACGAEKLGRCLGYSMLTVAGPNLFLWNIFGCCLGAIKYDDFCYNKENCDSDFLVIVMRVGTWSFLFLVSLICSYALWFAAREYCHQRKLKQKINNWRKESNAGEVLLDCNCSICLDEFRKNEKIITLESCKHFFHKECLDIWLQDHNTCPVCRATY